ncbi:MAG: hypothetical protein DMF39_07685 [Verrucomicrobia bacterium]|nr:MAG: hypothetical protein DMF39_07685 [Verrucomicrobiota bacterium]
MRFHGCYSPQVIFYYSIDPLFKLYSVQRCPQRHGQDLHLGINQNSQFENRKCREPAVGFEPTTC